METDTLAKLGPKCMDTDTDTNTNTSTTYHFRFLPIHLYGIPLIPSFVQTMPSCKWQVIDLIKYSPLGWWGGWFGWLVRMVTLFGGGMQQFLLFMCNLMYVRGACSPLFPFARPFKCNFVCLCFISCYILFSYTFVTLPGERRNKKNKEILKC